MQSTSDLSRTAFAPPLSLLRLRDALLRWAAAPDLTTTASVHYVSIPDALQRQSGGLGRTSHISQTGFR